MPEAARVEDQVQHSDAFPGLLTGLIVGALIGVAIVATGGGAIVVLAASATVATSASLGATAGELLGSLATDPAGPIRTGVSSVIIGPEHRVAATVYSYVDCKQHDSGVQVAEGSATVWIGAAGQYAARVGDKGTCGFEIAEGCRTVIIGGPTATAAGLSVGNEVPMWAQGLVLVLGLAGGGLGMALKGLSMGAIAARLGAGFLVGMGGSIGGGWLGGKLFGENSFGQRVFALGGGFLGAMLGEGMVSRSFPASGELGARTEPPVRGADMPESSALPTEDAAAKPQTPSDYHPGQQSGDNNCAPQSAQQIIHEATGRNYTEAEMEQIAQSTGQYHPDSGTVPGGEADILREGGVPATTMEPTPENIQRALDDGKGVITGHNAEDLWPGYPNFVDDPNNPASGGHSVQTTEVIRDSDGNVTGYRINDTGTGTAGRIVPADQYHASLDGEPAVVTENPIRSPRDGSVAPLDEAGSEMTGTGEPRTSGDNASYRGASSNREIPRDGIPISERENVEGATIPDYITKENENEYYYDTNTGRYTTRPEPKPDFSQGQGERTIPCFPAGTLVRTESGFIAINEISIGLSIVCYDEATRSLANRPVEHIWHNQAVRLISIQTGKGVILSTANHRFWVCSQQLWIEARYLQAGMMLLTESGSAEQITSIQKMDVKEQDTYNLTVADCHTYFVGVSSVLVHNEGEDPTGKIYYGYKSSDASKKPVYVGQTKQDLRDRERQHQKEGYEEPQDYGFKQDMKIEQVQGMDGLTDDQMDWHERRVYDEYTKQGYDLQNHQIPMTDEKINELQRQYCE